MIEPIEIKFKKLDEKAIIPSYSKDGDNGLDLTAISIAVRGDYIEYDTGISFEGIEGFVGLVYPRSSISNYNLIMCNSVGIIDQSYTGTIKVRMKKVIGDLFTRLNSENYYKPGDRVAQLIIQPCPKIIPIEVDEIKETNRGNQGFGSSGS